MSATALSYDTNYPPLGSQLHSLPNNPILINPLALHQLINQLILNQNSYSQIVANQPLNPSNQSKQTHDLNSKTAHHNQPNHSPKEAVKSFISKFISNLSFPIEQRCFLKLQREIKRCKPNANILNAYINKKNELVIRTPSIEENNYINEPWPRDAFIHGIKSIDSSPRLYLALHDVPFSLFDVDDEENKHYMLENYNIIKMMRIIKKKTNEPTNLIKAIVNDKDIFEKIINEKKIKIGNSYVRVSRWKFDQQLTQCFHCQKLGHNKYSCPNINNKPTCLRCQGEHEHKNCNINDPAHFKCANCGGNHPAVSKNCPSIEDFLKKKEEEEKIKLEKYKQKYTKANSMTASKTTPQIPAEHNQTNASTNPMNIVLFIIAIIKNLDTIHESIYENNSEIIKIINQFFGPMFGNYIKNYLTQSNLIEANQNTMDVIESELKILELNRLAKIYKIDIISLNETYLKPDKNFELPGFTTFRGDRLERRGGGAAICIKDNLISKKITLTDIAKLDNAIGCELTIDHNFKLAIFSIYSSPSNKTINDNLLYHISEQYKNFIIVGDFNAKSKSWYCEKENLSGNIMEEFLNKKNCHILNSKKPTYIKSKSILDLSICSNSIVKFFKSHRVLNNSISDHQPTITEFIDMSPKLRSFTQKKIDWEKFKTEIEKKIPTIEINSKDDIDLETNNIIEDIRKTIKQTTTQITFVCRAVHPIIIPRHIVELIKLKRKFKRIVNKTKNEYNTRVYNMLCHQVKKAVKSFKSTQINNEFLELERFNQSESKCWKLLKKLENPNANRDKNPSIELKKSDNSSTKDEKEIADMFSKSLAEIFKPEGHKIVYEVNLDQPVRATKTDKITKKEFFDSLKTLNSKASPGVDQITNKVFKNCPHRFLHRIFILFNASLKFGYVPKNWKISKIIMIPKKDKPPDNVNSYRPISLISCMSKWLEKIINTKLTSWLEKNKLIPNCQSGFRKKMNTHDHFIRLYHSIIDGFNKQEKTGAVFFDLEKAFDKVNHYAILTKLKKLNVSPTIYNWIISFLTDRKFFVSYAKSISIENSIRAGVPQGSSLSPTLFSLFFSDIVDYIPKNVQKALFADDLTIWYTDKNLKKIQNELQIAIEKIEKYCLFWGLKLNCSKTVYTVFTTAGYRENYEKNYQLTLKITKNVIPIDPSPRYLGHILDPKLNFKNHFKSISEKIINKINLIRKIKSLKIKNKTSISMLIYKSFIRPQLDYMFIAINNSTQRILQDCQKLQNRILRTIKYFPIRTKITDIHNSLNIEMLEKRYSKLFKKFVLSRLTHEQIQEDIQKYNQTIDQKHISPFDIFLNIA
ncbi:unnamed protein product, partial [Brachionus calyciflorus]